MSIWSSIHGDDVVALELGDQWPANQYQPTTPPSLVIDVATALSWRNDIRLAINDIATLGFGVDIDVLLSVENATRLRDNLTIALERIRTGSDVGLGD